jgi:hypothetical protein
MISPLELRTGTDFTRWGNRYISTVKYWLTRGSLTVYKEKAALFLLEITAITAMLVSLGAVAVPQASLMVHEENTQAKENELEEIQWAVDTMLRDSSSGTLVSAGPVTDIGNVSTTDYPPLKLRRYLSKVSTDRVYGFTSDGTVVLMTH